MIKRITAVIAVAVLAASLAGCRDYRGLDELSIVAGFAIDKSDIDPEMLHITFEIVDTTATADKRGKKTLVTEAEGSTIFEAIANGNEQLARDMYFGNAELLILHEDIARDVGLSGVIESIMRDFTIRDTMLLIVSRDERARDILALSNEKEKIVSYDIAGTLDWHKRNANSTRALEIFEIYDDLKRNTDSISLPAYEVREDGGEMQPEMNGLAVFQGDRFAGYLEAEDVPYFLCLCEPLSGGTIAFRFDEDVPDSDVTLRILSSKPELGHRVQDGELVLTADVELTVSLRGYSPSLPSLDDDMLARVEERAARVLEERARKTVARMQNGTGTDIFGFGKHIYRGDTAFWNTIRDDWEAHFRAARLDINAEFTIQRTGSLVDY